MKFHSLLTVTISLLLAGCQPKDNKLAPPPSSNPSSQAQSTGQLKVGSYGQPLVALQQLEQMGVLIQFCLIKTPVKDGACTVRFSDQAQGPQLIDQRWVLDLKSDESPNGFQQVTAELEAGQIFGKFKNEILHAEFINAEFTVKKTQGEFFDVSMMQNMNINGEILLTQIQAQLRMEGSVWTFTGIQSKLVSLNKNKTIQSSAKELQLVWKSSECAEATGLFDVQDGANKAQISVNGLGAKLVSSSRSSWSQKLVACEKRRHSHQNYDFLFY